MDNVQRLTERYRQWFADAFERAALGDRFDWELMLVIAQRQLPTGRIEQKPMLMLYAQTPGVLGVGSMHFNTTPLPTYIPDEESAGEVVRTVIEGLRAERTAQLNGSGETPGGLFLPPGATP